MFLPFLLYNWKNQRKTRIPRRNMHTGESILLLWWSKLEFKASYGFPPLWKHAQLRSWVPGTRTSLKPHLEDEVHAWELKLVKHSWQISNLQSWNRLQIFHRWEVLKAKAPQQQAEQVRKEADKAPNRVLHGITSPLKKKIVCQLHI